MEFDIRAESKEDVEHIFRVNKAAFETEDEAHLVDRLRDGGALTLSLVAADGPKIVGHIAFSPVVIESPTGAKNFVALGPMAVTPEYQRKGIGSALIRRGLDELSSRDISAVFVLGHAGYYPKFGFRPSKPSFGITSTYDVADEYFLATELKPNALAGATGTVTYRPEFNGI